MLNVLKIVALEQKVEKSSAVRMTQLSPSHPDPDQTRIREQLQMILVLVGFFILQTEAGGWSSS